MFDRDGMHAKQHFVRSCYSLCRLYLCCSTIPRRLVYIFLPSFCNLHYFSLHSLKNSSLDQQGFRFVNIVHQSVRLDIDATMKSKIKREGDILRIKCPHQTAISLFFPLRANRENFSTPVELFQKLFLALVYLHINIIIFACVRISYPNKGLLQQKLITRKLHLLIRLRGNWFLNSWPPFRTRRSFIGEIIFTFIFLIISRIPTSNAVIKLKRRSRIKFRENRNSTTLLKINARIYLELHWKNFMKSSTAGRRKGKKEEK